jgi:hypothetical protein
MANAHDVSDVFVRPSVNGVEPDNLPGWIEEVRADIERLRHLDPNWDGYGAPAIDPAIIDAAKSFVASLPATCLIPPHVVPTSSGALQLEWHDGPKSLELEFESPDSIRYLQWHPQANVEREESFPMRDKSKSAALIEWFMSREGR